MDLRFWVKAYKSEGVYYGASGEVVPIFCNHTQDGQYGMNISGQIIPLPNATNPTTNPPASPGTVNVPHGTQFPTNIEPNLDLVNVTKIKDNVTQTVYWVDTESYNANVVQCNPAPYASSCPAVTNLDATPGTTDADITWDENPGIVGVEYANSAVDAAPTSGTFVAVGTGTVSIGSLTTATAYYFFIRTICTGAVTSSWSRVAYTTL